MVPAQATRFTSPEGPQPLIINVPSRGKHQIPVHIFIPTSVSYATITSIPVMLDFHGGGFVLGSCLEQAPFCSLMARSLGCIVISVDYRMGPIDKFPAALHDAEDILSAVLSASAIGHRELTWAVNNKLLQDGLIKTAKHKIVLDHTRVAIAGFSSGGNLALELALEIMPPQVEASWPCRFAKNYKHSIPLLLFYPSFDSRQLPSERTRPPKMPIPSGFWEDVNDKLMPTYLPREQAGHPRASPGLADLRDGGLHAQARMLLVLPELDNLAHQSEVWVKKVAEQGRDEHLVVERFEGHKHGWTQMPVCFLCSEAMSCPG